MKYKIEGIELTPVHVPFKENIRRIMQDGGKGVGMAIKVDEEWSGGDFVICKLFCEDKIGLGESFVWLPETGIAPEQIIDIIKRALCKYIINQSPFNIERILYKMDNNVARNEVSKGLLDIACYDLIGKIVERPVYDLIGGRTVDEIPLTALIPLTDPEIMGAAAKVFFKMKYRNFRYKLGGEGIENDIKISEIIREVLGKEVNLRVDYNQAYSPSKAVRAIRSIEQFNIELAEQPVKANNFVGMAYVQKQVNIPLMAHEGFFSLQDFITLVELNAVGVLGVNSERPGGMTKALKAINYAEQRGLGTVIHNQPLGIGSAMHIHLATAKFNSLGYAPELFGDIMMEDDLIKTPLEYNNGFVKVPNGSGYGVELDENALKKYSTGPTTIIGKTS